MWQNRKQCRFRRSATGVGGSNGSTSGGSTSGGDASRGGIERFVQQLGPQLRRCGIKSDGSYHGTGPGTYGSHPTSTTVKPTSNMVNLCTSVAMWDSPSRCSDLPSSSTLSCTWSEASSRSARSAASQQPIPLVRSRHVQASRCTLLQHSCSPA